MSQTSSRTNASKTVAGKTPTIGVLALQGDFAMHQQALENLGITPSLVKMPDQLKNLDGLIIPGGESTALLHLCKPIGMLEAIKGFAKQGGHIFGTCAGAILLAKTVTNPEQESLGLIDITIERNGYGRQLESDEVAGRMYPPLGNGKIPVTLIRAPRITYKGQTHVLVTYKQELLMVQQENILISTFHPEFTNSSPIISYWLNTNM